MHMVLSCSRGVGLLLLALCVLSVSLTSASDVPSAAAGTNAQETAKDSKTDTTLASTQQFLGYDSHDPKRQQYHPSNNNEYYNSRSRHDEHNNQYYSPREQQHTAYEDPERYHSSEQYKARQYDSRPSYKHYDSYDSHYGQERQAHDHDNQHNESYGRSYLHMPAHRERNVVQVCLQRYGQPTINNGTWSQEFVCCNGPSVEDSCIRNSTYGYGSHQDAYDAYAREDSTSFMDTMLTPEIAAVCTSDFNNGKACPEWADVSVVPEDPGCNGGITVKCTLTKYASKCGCPAHAAGLQFESNAYSSNIAGVSCAYDCLSDDIECFSTETYNPVTSGGPYSGNGIIYQGGFPRAFTRGEAAHIEGSLEYTEFFFARNGAPDVKRTTATTASHGVPAKLLPESVEGLDLPIFKSGQLKIRLADD